MLVFLSADFDENVLRQLVFTASYDLKCDAIQQGGFGTNLQTVAEHNFKQIEELCQAGKKQVDACTRTHIM